MSCPRYKEKCNEFMCGSSIDGVCTEGSNVRNPNRIYNFTNELTRIWITYYPDWRFGQLMCNFLGWVSTEKKNDPFFPEEDQMLTYLKEYCGEENNGRGN